MGSQVFISYSSKDKDPMELLKSYLDKHNVKSMWIDEERIKGGENISERLKEGVRNCALMILLLNKHSLVSTWCMAEVGAFWGANKKIIVYPIEPRCGIPPLLIGTKHANSPSEVVEACQGQHPYHPQSISTYESLHFSMLTHAFRIPVDDHCREKRVEELVAHECSKSEQKKFCLVASSGRNYLHPTGKVWLAGLGDAIMKSMAEFQVVLESPFSQFAVTRALANRVNCHHWDEKVNLDHIEMLLDKYNVTIQVTEHPVNCSLFFTSDAVFYDPYLWALPSKSGRTENNFWVFEFGMAESQLYDCYSLLKNHFDFLATESIPLREFLGKDRKLYNERTQAFRQKMVELRRKRSL